MNDKVPTHIFGTAWKEDKTTEAVLRALTAGYRAIDTASQRKHYHEQQVGDALAQTFTSMSLSRSDIFLQTKFTHRGGQDHRLPYDEHASVAEQVFQSFATSCKNLQTDYFDSYVLHGPTHRAGLSADDRAAWQSMEALHATGKVKKLGISNVSLSQLKELCEVAKVKPSFVQNRCYPSINWDFPCVGACQEMSLVYQGFSLIRDPVLFDSPKVQALAKSKNKTVAQIVFRFAHQLGMQILCGSQNSEHLSQSLDIFDFEMSDEEMKVIALV
jgi:diketogulonate reductase-like aldo/keto reductase